MDTLGRTLTDTRWEAENTDGIYQLDTYQYDEEHLVQHVIDSNGDELPDRIQSWAYEGNILQTFSIELPEGSDILRDEGVLLYPFPGLLKEETHIYNEKQQLVEVHIGGDYTFGNHEDRYYTWEEGRIIEVENHSENTGTITQTRLYDLPPPHLDHTEIAQSPHDDTTFQTIFREYDAEHRITYEEIDSIFSFSLTETNYHANGKIGSQSITSGLEESPLIRTESHTYDSFDRLISTEITTEEGGFMTHHEVTWYDFDEMGRPIRELTQVDAEADNVVDSVHETKWIWTCP